MPEDHKIIRMRPEGEAPSPLEETSEELYQLLEKKLEDSLSALHADRNVEKENLRKEIRSIIADFETRMNERFQELYRERGDEKPAGRMAITGTAKHISNVLRKIINVPDL
jgi:vacuolar-type H+-ATPase subunit H